MGDFAKYRIGNVIKDKDICKQLTLQIKDTSHYLSNNFFLLTLLTCSTRLLRAKQLFTTLIKPTKGFASDIKILSNVTGHLSVI